MKGIVEFNIEGFKELYPMIELNDAQLKYCFEKAELRVNNTKNSPVCSLKERKILLNLLTAHLALLQDRINKGNDSVGRVASATEGSVSVSLDFPTSGSALMAWFAQTPYGAEFWTLTSKYRGMHYVAGESSMKVNRTWEHLYRGR